MHRILERTTLGLLVALSMLLVLSGQTLSQAPPVGDDVPIADENGVTRGTITLREVADPFAEADPARPPAEGRRYVGLIAAFTAADDQTMAANPSSLWLHDTDGWIYWPTYVQRPADPLQPDLSSQELAPGNRISGFVGYDIPADATVDEIVYSPTGYVATPIADLLDVAGPEPGAAVVYVDATGSQGTIMIDVQDPFTASDPAYPPEAGMRYVGLVAAIENTGAVPFRADPGQLYLRTSDGALYWPTYVYRSAGVTMADLESQTMSPGDRISGFVGYQVPEASTVAGIDLWPSSDRRVELADLTGDQSGSSSVATVSPSPDAEASHAPDTTPGISQ